MPTDAQTPGHKGGSAVSDDQIAAWVEQAVDNDTREWMNEEACFSKLLYVGCATERDRREIHAEAKRGVRTCKRFWKQIPAELREQVATEAGLALTAIPGELR